MKSYLLMLTYCFLWCRKDIDGSATELNNDLAKTSHWAYHWKINELQSRSQEVIFSSRVNQNFQPPLTFNNNIVYESTSQSGIILDNRLSFEEHLRLIFSKTNKTTGLLSKP